MSLSTQRNNNRKEMIGVIEKYDKKINIKNKKYPCFLLDQICLYI